MDGQIWSGFYLWGSSEGSEPTQRPCHAKSDRKKQLLQRQVDACDLSEVRSGMFRVRPYFVLHRSPPCKVVSSKHNRATSSTVHPLAEPFAAKRSPAPPLEPRNHAAMRAGGRNVTSFAYDLHRSVPADRWCVTYWDLVFLGQEVSSALGRGEIQPGPEDDTSRAYGPSIYTVNEQYIKPVTKEAGKMSWALMRHPDGLQCDLFMSHAWQEGIFEFLAKVQHSWPWGLRTAWCCMLANPQNLDISFFLQSPKTSPFAIALQASEVMLVVPNRHQSVYARLWRLPRRK